MVKPQKSYFNKGSSVGSLLKKVKFDQRLSQANLNTFDLRFFSLVSLTDTFDGKCAPLDGVTYKAVLYGNQIVWERFKQYDHGSGVGTKEAGDERFWTMYLIAEIYKKILWIAHHKFFNEELPENMKNDLVSCYGEELAILCRHPQYLELVRDKGLKLFPQRGKNSGRFRVTVSKHHHRTTH